MRIGSRRPTLLFCHLPTLKPIFITKYHIRCAPPAFRLDTRVVILLSNGRIELQRLKDCVREYRWKIKQLRNAVTELPLNQAEQEGDEIMLCVDLLVAMCVQQRLDDIIDERAVGRDEVQNMSEIPFWLVEAVCASFSVKVIPEAEGEW